MALTNYSQKRSHDQFANDLYDASPPPARRLGSENADTQGKRRALARSIIVTFGRDSLSKIVLDMALKDPATMKAIIDMNSRNLTHQLLAEEVSGGLSVEGIADKSGHQVKGQGSPRVPSISQPRPSLLSNSNFIFQTSANHGTSVGRPSSEAATVQTPTVVHLEQSAVNGDESAETPAPISTTLNRTAAQISSQTEKEGTPTAIIEHANATKSSTPSQISFQVATPLSFDEVPTMVKVILSKLPVTCRPSEDGFGTYKAAIIAILENSVYARVRQESCFGTKSNALRASRDLCFLFVSSCRDEEEMLGEIITFMQRVVGWMSPAQKTRASREKAWWKSMLSLKDLAVGKGQREVLSSMLHTLIPVAAPKERSASVRRLAGDQGT